MKLFFSTVASHNPTLAAELPEHMIYPVSQRVGGALDLDYTPLLLGDGFIIDGHALQVLVEGDDPHLKPMVESLTRLLDAGLLEPVDMAGIIGANADGIIEKTELLLEDHTEWLELMQAQWRRVKPEFQEFQRHFGSEELRELNLGHLGVESWLAEIGRDDDPDLRARLMDVMEGVPNAEERVSAFDLRGAMRFVIAEILCVDLIRHSLRSPFVDWADTQPFFDRLYSTRWDREQAEEYAIQRQARLLFDAVVPELRPGNVDAVIKFVHDNKAVSSLRSELIACIGAGEEVSKDWLLSYFKQAAKSDLVAEGRMRKVRWLGSALGVALPGASLVSDIAGEAVQKAVEESGEAVVRPLGPANPHWYYALQELVGTRRD